MRFGTFLLGGLVGAATVIYLSDKKNRSMMFSAVTSPTDSLGKVLGKTKEKAMDTLLNATTGSGNKSSNSNAFGSTVSAAQTGTSTAGTANAGKDSMAQVEKIVNEDPELKQTVNNILSDSGKTSTALQ